MMINWKVRIRNRAWWLSVIPAFLLLVQVIAVPFGYEFEFGALNEQLIAIINAAFVFLALLRIVNDPTTEGLEDSTRAMGYEIPYPKTDSEDTIEE